MRIHEVSQWEFARVLLIGIFLGAYFTKKLTKKPITKEIKDFYDYGK